MIGDITVADEIYIVCGYTDMRKSIDGLCAIVEDKLHMDPRSSALFLFCGRRCDRIKILMWEPDGFVLLYKRLSAVQGRYRWPRNRDEVRSLTWKEFDWLLMILANLGQRSYNFRTTFPKYTDSVLKSFGQRTLSQRDKLAS